MMSALEYTRLEALARDHGWNLKPDVIVDVSAGIELILRRRWPKADADDLAPIQLAVRDRACALLSDNRGNWPERPRGEKRNHFAIIIDELILSQNDLFVAALVKN